MSTYIVNQSIQWSNVPECVAFRPWWPQRGPRCWTRTLETCSTLPSNSGGTGFPPSEFAQTKPWNYGIFFSRETIILEILTRHFSFKFELNDPKFNPWYGMQLPVPARLPRMCETPVPKKELWAATYKYKYRSVFLSTLFLSLVLLCLSILLISSVVVTVLPDAFMSYAALCAAWCCWQCYYLVMLHFCHLVLLNMCYLIIFST